MILVLNVHYSRVSDLLSPDHLVTLPSIPITGYRDSFGNWCNRIVAPQGRVKFTADAVIHDQGEPDQIDILAKQHDVPDLPDDVLLFLLPSRYCETDTLMEQAWSLFERTPSGWARVQAICDFVHEKIQFGYEHARPTRSAWQVLNEGKGVCRDFAHLGIALCRCMNIPARYCTGYLGDIGIPPPGFPMDFSAWFEAYLDGRWYVFDPRNNVPRVGRILIARGRDAADVAIATTFGSNTLTGFKVWTDQVSDSEPAMSAYGT
jgi:transglutaminase-like putative cysteine protease